jgi:cell division septum initiation protein DivIVA
MVQESEPPPSGAAFGVVRRGYDPGQVDNHLRRLDAEIQILVTDREAALGQSAQLARELDDARAHAEQLRAEQEISRARVELDAERERAERERAALWADSESCREEVEEDFRIAMNRRRSEALTRLAEERECLAHEVHVTRVRTAAQARAHLEQARARAQAITAEACRRVHELVELRTRIIEQLGGAHSTLEEVLTALQPVPGERGRIAQPDSATTSAADPASATAAPSPEPGPPTAAGTTPAPPTTEESAPTPRPRAATPARPDNTPPRHGAPRASASTGPIRSR